MQTGLLIIGSILSLLFIAQLFRGQGYEALVEGVDEKKYPLKELYVVGFAWSHGPPFSLRGAMGDRLKKQAALIYGPQYADYYANLQWAMGITLVHLISAVTCIYAAWQNSGTTFLIGMFIALLAGVYAVENMHNELSKRTADCELELPEVVSTMAILVNSGMVLRDAWRMIGESSEGAIYKLMREAGENMQNGYSDADAILLFGRATDSPEIIKFTSALLQSMEKGGSELPLFLAKESSELWSSKRQKTLQLGEKASAKLLAPIMLVFIGIIIIIMAAAFAGSLF
ncbi:bacterial type II secretion system protein F domain protein [Oribacterium sp. oral taxon 078 str. F0263]|uniref:type II secretion system F family protein n=1 Tax=Oribacterium sp. oral taxon 078 TaxID=652706 RepID=UPI0001BCC1FF|nr:type II secretion system F family protein [Oribacterium sp. oral taxon 078]EFE91347.1 bacterial type II secretion system domain protein F [Oribacterium sp. oral taxon 078 str. F0262]ERL22535.1 bacterial type II secretion system protein F domain protein [Oribacterium sp. oral taxon 078 str. F0263]